MGRQSVGMVWRVSCHNLALEEKVEAVVQKALLMAPWPLSRSWFGDMISIWGRPSRVLHSAWRLAMGRIIAEAAYDVCFVAQIPL